MSHDVKYNISDDLSDDDDINRQRRTLYVQGNIVLQKCIMCSLEVKLTLFRSYCSPMYGVHLWWNYKKSTLNRLHIAYQNILKLFIGMSKYESTSLLYTLFHVQCCQSVIRNMVYRFMCRLDSSVNCILNDILTSSLRFTSRIRKHWNKHFFFIYEHLTKTNVYILLIYTALGQNTYCTYCPTNVNVWTS